jgi:hypothetical protein
VEKELLVPERDHALDSRSVALLNEFQDRWEIIA